MQLPNIHMNGTAPIDLMLANMSALGSARELLRALEQAAPNGRDYYHSGPDALNVALNEHRARVAAVQKIARELEAICEHIQDAGHAMAEGV